MRHRVLLFTVVLAACTHSEPFTTPVFAPLGAFSDSTFVQLTFNAGLDYAPGWTADHRAIGYVYSLTTGDVNARCMAILPAAGGTQLWSRCDDRLSQRDSSAMFGTPSIGPAGQLLYLEGTAELPGIPHVRITLWLADTAAPFVRDSLTYLPTTVGGTTISWLDGITWTDSNTFVALGEDIKLSCGSANCTTATLAFPGLMVVRGTVTRSGVTLAPIAGTTGAAAFSLANQGASIVFVTANSLDIQEVPIAGGTPSTLLTLTFGGAIRSVSCRGEECVALTGPPPLVNFDATTLWVMNLALAQVISDQYASTIYDLVRVSPQSGDAVFQGSGNLFLWKNFLP